jgi:hypothetical protein
MPAKSSSTASSASLIQAVLVSSLHETRFLRESYGLRDKDEFLAVEQHMG